MTSYSRHVLPGPQRTPFRVSFDLRRQLPALAGLVSFSLAAVFALAPPPWPSADARFEAYISSHAQTLKVSNSAEVASFERGQYSSTPGFETFAASATNYDWAKLVLLSGGWPLSDNNVTVLLRWMRQENGANNWWNRSNPLNNGFGSGGGGGTGTYANLIVAAQKVAQGLQRPMFGGIVAALASSAPTQVTEHAIWASGWSTSHYANGAHWSYAPVPTYKAPASAW